MTKCLIKSKLFYFLIQKLNLHVHQLFLLDMFLLFPGFHVFGDSIDIFSIIISDNSGISMTLLNTSFNSSISSFDNSDLGVIYPVITETPLSLFKSILTNFCMLLQKFLLNILFLIQKGHLLYILYLL